MRKKLRPIAMDGELGIVPLTKGQRSIIDAFKVSSVAPWCWRAIWSPHGKCYYAGRGGINEHGRITTVQLHRAILGVTDPKIFVDHINHDTLDNRVSNLRACTPSESCHNMRTPRRNTTGFKGVGRYGTQGKYRAYISVNGVGHWKYGFDTADAAYAYRQEELSKLHGEFYCAG